MNIDELTILKENILQIILKKGVSWSNIPTLMVFMLEVNTIVFFERLI
jgi:hypothetical protein